MPTNYVVIHRSAAVPGLLPGPLLVAAAVQVQISTAVGSSVPRAVSRPCRVHIRGPTTGRRVEGPLAGWRRRYSPRCPPWCLPACVVGAIAATCCRQTCQAHRSSGNFPAGWCCRLRPRYRAVSRLVVTWLGTSEAPVRSDAAQHTRRPYLAAAGVAGLFPSRLEASSRTGF